MRTVFVVLLAVAIAAVVVVAEDRKTCRLSPSAIPFCNQGQRVEVNATTGCPTCRPRTCDNVRCNVSTLGFCADGTLPVLVDCCPNCRPKICTDKEKDACRAVYNNLTVCANGTTPVWLTSTCCYNCRLPPPPPADRPDNQGRCNVTQFAACVQSAPVCADGEEPSRNKSFSCCPTCIRPERLCSKEEVAQCRATVRPCDNNELPVFTAGNCCPSCILTRPNCTATCPTGTVCVRRLPFNNGTARDPVCRNATYARIGFAIGNAVRRAIIANFTCEQIIDWIQEIVERFCDKNQNADNCTRFQESINNLVATLSGNACKGQTNLTVAIPEPPSDATPAAFHHFLTEAFHTQATGDVPAFAFVNAALADPEANDGDTLEASYSSATRAIFSFAAGIACVALTVFGLFQN